MLQGELIRLRKFRADEVELFEKWATDYSYNTGYNNFGLRSISNLHNEFAANGLLGARHGSLLITLPDDTIVGDISYRQVAYGPGDMAQAFNIGIRIAPEHRGHGYGVDAQRLLAKYLFSTFPVVRVEASTDIVNIPEQRALEKAGFTREGVLRKAQWREGEWHDMVVYSKLRGE